VGFGGMTPDNLVAYDEPQELLPADAWDAHDARFSALVAREDIIRKG